MNTEETALVDFVEAIGYAGAGLYIDAINKFTQLINDHPDSDLVDDAFYNAGLCYFHLNSFDQAISNFKIVIDKYPNAGIYTFGDHKEYGKTAAKCYYAVINCYLGMGQYDKAVDELKKLAQFQDSYVETAAGEKISFFDLASKAVSTYKQFAI